MGGATGDDLDGAGVIEVAEAANNVTSQGLKMLQRPLIKPEPEAGDVLVVGLTAAAKIFRVLPGSINLLLRVFGECRLKRGVIELLQQHRRKIYVGLQRQALRFQLRKNAKQRQIGFSGGLVEPVQAVRPGAVMHHVRQVRVQGEGDIPCRGI